jgi:hypothetical protein
MYRILLAVHISAGTAALLGAAGALATAKGDRWHVLFGRAFALGMSIVVFTALPITIAGANAFLFLIALFSFYLVFTGWSRARNRTGTPGGPEWIAAGSMIATAAVMIVWGLAMLRGGDSLGLALLAFAGIGGGFAVGDLYSFRRNPYRGPARIAAHLTRMLGGTIAALTAFAVVNVQTEPTVAVWLAPTVLLTPVIVYWIIHVRAQG